jgi:hypothetical protein
MRLSPPTGFWKDKTSTTAIPVPTDNENSSTILDDNEIYIVSVDSRGKSVSDLESYKEISVQPDFFRDHIHDDPKNICAKSQVAGLCGLDMKVYFHDHSHFHHLPELLNPLSPIGRTNGAATMLLFNPEANKFNYVVHSKAYVLLNDGRSPLSKQQVWEIVELIREVKCIYDSLLEEGLAKNNHLKGKEISQKDPDRSPPTSPLQHVRTELTKICSRYQHERWLPNGISEQCHVRGHRQHRHHGKHHHKTQEKCHKNELTIQDKVCGCKNEYVKQESGVSDAATCHHGICHHHHNVASLRPNDFFDVPQRKREHVDSPHLYHNHQASH